MRLLIIMFVIPFMISCSTKYRGLHNDVSQFKEDVNYCLKKLCQSEIKSSFTEFSIISTTLAYGGGGGAGLKRNSMHKVSLKRLNICLKERGYSKDENGSFILPSIRCK